MTASQHHQVALVLVVKVGPLGLVALYLEHLAKALLLEPQKGAQLLLEVDIIVKESERLLGKYLDVES